MTVSANWNALSGSWFTAANWSEPNPSPPPPLLHYVPGSTEDVSIPDNSNLGNAFTVSYSGTDTINSLNGSVVGTLDMTSGSLTLLNGGVFSSMKVNVGAGVTLSVSASTLVTTGGTYAGTISGAGGIAMVAGTFTLNAGLSVTAAYWTLGVATNGTVSQTTLNTDLAYANTFTLADISGNHAVLNLNGHTLTLSGTTTLDGTANGPGTLLITGAATEGVTANGGINIIGGATLEYASGSTGLEHHDASLGSSTTLGTLKIDSGAHYTIDQNVTLGNSLGTQATVTNAGTLEMSGASTGAAVSGQFTNTGALVVDSTDSLTLSNGAENLNGALSGAGTLVFGYTANATINTTNVTVAALTLNGGNGGALLTLGLDLTYGGAFSFANQFDTLALNSHTLTLSGASNSLLGNTLKGAGTLKVTGTASLGSNIGVGAGGGGAATVENAGTINQTGGVSLSGTILNDAGHTYNITAASTVSNVSNASFTNNGVLSDNAAGLSEIDGTYSGSGTISVGAGATLRLAAGTQTLSAAISGAGQFNLGFGANATLNTTNVTVGALSLSGGNGGATLRLGVDLNYTGTFSFLNLFDTLALNGHTLTLGGAANVLNSSTVSGPGVLKITGGATFGLFLTVGSSTVAGSVEDAGVITQNGYVTLNGSLQIDAASSYNFTTDDTLTAAGTTLTITNAGTLAKTAGTGTSTVAGAYSGAGAVSVQSGTLALTGGASFGGAVSGPGTLALSGGAVSFLAGATATVGKLAIIGTTATFQTSLTLSGELDVSGFSATLKASTGKTFAATGPFAELGGINATLHVGSATDNGTVDLGNVGGAGFGAGQFLEIDGGTLNIRAGLSLAGVTVTFQGTGAKLVLNNTAAPVTVGLGASSSGEVDLNSAQVNFAGGGETAMFVGGSGNIANLSNTGGVWDIVGVANGSSGVANLTSALAQVTGGGASVNFAGGAGDAVQFFNTGNVWDTVTATGATVGAVYLTSALAQVNGGGENINFWGGAGNAAQLVGTGGNWDYVRAASGSSGSVYLTGALAQIIGGGDTVYFWGGAGNATQLVNTGNVWDVVNAASGSTGATYLTNAWAQINGGGETAYFWGGTGNLLHLANTGSNWDVVNAASGSTGTVFLTNGWAQVNGGGDNIQFLGGTSNAVHLANTGGVWDGVSASSGVTGTVYLTNGQTQVAGGGDTIDFLGGSGNQVSLVNTGAAADNVNNIGAVTGTVYLTNAGANIQGSGDTVDFYAGTNNSANVSGSNEAFVFAQGAFGLDTISGFNASDSLSFNVANQGHLTVMQSNGSTLIKLDTSDIVTLAGYTGTVTLNYHA